MVKIFYAFSNGNTTKKLDIVGTSNSETGTEVTFQPLQRFLQMLTLFLKH